MTKEFYRLQCNKHMSVHEVIEKQPNSPREIQSGQLKLRAGSRSILQQERRYL